MTSVPYSGDAPSFDGAPNFDRAPNFDAPDFDDDRAPGRRPHRRGRRGRWSTAGPAGPGPFFFGAAMDAGDDEGEDRGHHGPFRAGPGRSGRRGGFGPAGPGADFGPAGPGAGFGPGGPPGFGPGGPGGFGPGPFGGRGQRRRGRQGRRGARGDVRAAILLLLTEEPMHGYQLIQQMAERSSGVWRPSPGSVYPTLSQLADEGLILVSSEEGRNVASLTDAGKVYVEEHREKLGSPWDQVAGSVKEEAFDVKGEIGALMGAVTQVIRVGSAGQVGQVTKILADTRKRLYRILADDDVEAAGPGRPSTEDAASSPDDN